MNNPIAICDLLDANEASCQVAEPGLIHFGGQVAFSGPITTVAVFEDNALVKQMLGEPGHGGVLVVDGGGSMRCALLGDILGGMAVANNWVGVVINGCVRDSKALAQLPVGVMALNTMPRKGVKRGEGRRDVPVAFSGVRFQPGHFLYADEDGLIVAPTPLQDG